MDKFELIVLGRTVGTVTGWDFVNDNETSEYVFFDFIPNKKFDKKLPQGDVSVNFKEGILQKVGSDEVNVDMVDLLKDFPRTSSSKSFQRVQ